MARRAGGILPLAGAWLVAAALGACTHIPLPPELKQHPPRVLLVVGADRPPSKIGAMQIRGGGGAPRSLHAHLREALAKALNYLGWSVQTSKEVPSVESGSLADPRWPPELCTKVRERGAEAGLWIIVYSSWEPSVGGALNTLDTMAMLVGCNTNRLLWRDRFIAHVTVAYGTGPGTLEHSVNARGYVDDAEQDQLIDNLVNGIVASLNAP